MNVWEWLAKHDNFLCTHNSFFEKLCSLTRYRTPNDRPILCVDFDGTISNYQGGFVGFDEVGIGSDPVPGAFNFLEWAVQRYRVVIWTVRCNHLGGQKGICKWLLHKGLPDEVIDQLEFSPGKPNAVMFIDDRAIQFKGDWNGIAKEVLRYETWYSD